MYNQQFSEKADTKNKVNFFFSFQYHHYYTSDGTRRHFAQKIQFFTRIKFKYIEVIIESIFMIKCKFLTVLFLRVLYIRITETIRNCT
jgi:hypothetical protein